MKLQHQQHDRFILFAEATLLRRLRPATTSDRVGAKTVASGELQNGEVGSPVKVLGAADASES